MPNKIILIHGFSDDETAMVEWKRQLEAKGFECLICRYYHLADEITLHDVAEGLDRALREESGLEADEEFDAVVYSTGMLVIRAWLARDVANRKRLKRLIGLAPATFGSPLAHKGRSFAATLFKGNKEPGQDWMEVGKPTLSALELASQFTWDLAHQDLIVEKPFYGASAATPYVFIFVGTHSYTGLRRVVNEPGTDGTVRWAGVALNTRKIVLDLSGEPGAANAEERVHLPEWTNVDIPAHFVYGRNHGTITSEPPDTLVDLVEEALKVDTAGAYRDWLKVAKAWSEANWAKAASEQPDEHRRWQQFVVHARDERGDPITDFMLQLVGERAGGERVELGDFDKEVHAYEQDKSFRCFHVDAGALLELFDATRPDALKKLFVRVMAATGNTRIGYFGYGGNTDEGEVEVEITEQIKDGDFSLLYPFTTTLVELILNREPLPRLPAANDVTYFPAVHKKKK